MKIFFFASLAAVAFAAISEHGLRGGLSLVETEAGTFKSLEHLASEAFDSGNMGGINGIMKNAEAHISYENSLKVLRKRQLPPHMAALLEANKADELTEASLTKGRNFLHKLIEGCWEDLDELIIAAKEFQDRNRGTYDQVVADISRLGGQIASHVKRSTDATTCIADMERQVEGVEKKMASEEDAYLKGYRINYADMQIKQADLDVFDFLIKTTRTLCDKFDVSSDLLQTGQTNMTDDMMVCESDEGSELRFRDLKLQAKLDRLLAKGSHDLMRIAMGNMQSSGEAFIQVSQTPSMKIQSVVPVQRGQHERSIELRCPGKINNCFKLYDTMSLTWGIYKDKVDELKATMTDNAAKWRELKAGFQAQIESLTSAGDACGAQLSGATSDKNTDQQLLREKIKAKRELDSEHRQTMRKFRKDGRSTMGDCICPYTVVRNELMKKSDPCEEKGGPIDCTVSDWNPDACSVECDDSCPESADCGGIQNLQRGAIVINNSYGMGCPKFYAQRKCNQIKCPVNCVESRWSGFSKCSRDCEGGAQERSRSILTKPKNGGIPCKKVAQPRDCNMGSCDRDCTLSDWSEWSPCSMACGGGNQERRKSVVVEIRADGECEKTDSPGRYENQACNTQPCEGDEICIAEQDLVIAIDGSGSVSDDNWKLSLNFTGELLNRYQSDYYGLEKMRVGIIRFGNGQIETDGTVSKAVVISKITRNLKGTNGVVETLKKDFYNETAKDWKKHGDKGFTNMAQAFALADTLLTRASRKTAQAAVLMITDAKPSFLFETKQRAKALDEKGVMKYFVGIMASERSEDWRLVESLATKPAFTNTVFVPGYEALADGGGPFVEQAITKFCPMAHSPSLTLAKDKKRGYMLVKESGYCGWLGDELGTNVIDPQACFELAQRAGAQAFSMGRNYRHGHCYIEIVGLTCKNYLGWRNKPDDPKCMEWNGKFGESMYYDWYALEPDSCS